jgi:2-polyprenyl-3-methyl-5-hydroxy-6-metoxy-1,4-benzoquinol methylase
VSGYVLDHHLEGEGRRLALMSRLLDPMHRRHLGELGIGPGDKALEVGCGNGSISAWLAGQVAPGGGVVGLDLDLSLIAARAPDLEFRQGDILAGPVDPGSFDLVTARAVLHHVADVEQAIANLVAGLAPGGAILLIEPDFLPVSVAGPPPTGEFWEGWLAWSRGQGIDYHVGRTLAPRLAALVGSGHLDERLIDSFLARCADPAWWTETISFTAVRARRSGVPHAKFTSAQMGN